MTWRENELALDVLAVQGHYDEDTRTLNQSALAESIRNVFLREPIHSSQDDILDKKLDFSRRV